MSSTSSIIPGFDEVHLRVHGHGNGDLVDVLFCAHRFVKENVSERRTASPLPSSAAPMRNQPDQPHSGRELTLSLPTRPVPPACAADTRQTSCSKFDTATVWVRGVKHF